MPASSELGYSTKEVSKLLGLRPREIRRFVEAEILEPESGADGESQFSFQDLVLLRAAKRLSEAKVPTRRIRSALSSLRRRLPEQTPAGVRIAAHGTQVVVRDGSSVWDPESGQELFDFALSEIGSATPLAQERRPREQDSTAGAGECEAAQELYDQACELETTSAEGALELYSQVLELDPDHIDAHLNLGRLLHESGELKGAVGHYRQALRIAPDEATAAYNLGVALEDLGQEEGALAAYERAITSDERCAEAYYNAAHLLEKAGDKGQALRYLKEYRQLLARPVPP